MFSATRVSFPSIKLVKRNFSTFQNKNKFLNFKQQPPFSSLFKWNTNFFPSSPTLFGLRNFSEKIKETTGIVGLPVEPNYREVGIAAYTKLLKEIQVFESSAYYRQVIEQIATTRLKAFQEESDYEAIEKRVNCGQVEELIEDAINELELIPFLIKTKPWESDREPVVVLNDGPFDLTPSEEESLGLSDLEKKEQEAMARMQQNEKK